MKPSVLFFIMTLTLSFLFSCSSKKEGSSVSPENENTILGKWQATWIMSGDDVKNEDAKNLRVSGIVNFMDSSNVEITMYGFDGNLIISDTTTNILNWKLEDKIMRFIDKDDIHGIPYVVEDMNPEEIRMSIMGDIKLTLKK